ARGVESGQGRGRAARRGNPIEHVQWLWSEEDHTVRVPGAAPGVGRVAQGLRRPARGRDLLELAFREESDETTVGRPEGPSAFLRPREWPRRQGLEGTHPQEDLAIGDAAQNHASSVRRDGKGAAQLRLRWRVDQEPRRRGCLGRRTLRIEGNEGKQREKEDAARHGPWQPAAQPRDRARWNRGGDLVIPLVDLEPRVGDVGEPPRAIALQAAAEQSP